MTYRIEGLSRHSFEPLFALDDDQLASLRARRVTADADHGYPCRVSLQDARAGERLILVNHVSHDVPTPFRTSYAIFVREDAVDAPIYEDRLPPLFDGRTLGLRAFDAEGMLKGAALALPGEADQHIRTLFERDEIASIHAHNAAYGCFLAKIERN